VSSIRKPCLALVFAAFLAASASGAVLEIGGPLAISTSDPPYGSEGLLSEGEVATATSGYVVAPDGSGLTLTLTVTNTSPAVTGTESPTVPDAPSISDIFFGVPASVETMTLLTAGGVSGSLSGWQFNYDPDATPSSGFGFLKGVFDSGLDGGPGGDLPDPVIASINDPVITDEPGDPLASPVDFVFDLGFGAGGVPSGFSADWFCDAEILGYPDYIGAAKFMSGADGGSGTVTNEVPEPATLVVFLTGMFASAAAGRMRRGRG